MIRWSCNEGRASIPPRSFPPRSFRGAFLVSLLSTRAVLRPIAKGVSAPIPLRSRTLVFSKYRKVKVNVRLPGNKPRWFTLNGASGRNTQFIYVSYMSHVCRHICCLVLFIYEHIQVYIYTSHIIHTYVLYCPYMIHINIFRNLILGEQSGIFHEKYLRQ